MHDETKELLRRSMRYITAIPREAVIGFSGGKDSVCLAEVMRRAGHPGRLVYSATGIDPPPMVQFIKREYGDRVTWVRPPSKYYRNLALWGPPTIHTRWCCEALKHFGSRVVGTKFRVLGVRREESTRRSKYKVAEARKGMVLYFPILEWKLWHVWDFIESEGLPVCSLYDEIDRVGCVICPYHTPKQHEWYRTQYPGPFRFWERVVKEWWLRTRDTPNRKGERRYMVHNTPEDFMAAWFIKACWAVKGKRDLAENAKEGR